MHNCNPVRVHGAVSSMWFSKLPESRLVLAVPPHLHTSIAHLTSHPLHPLRPAAGIGNVSGERRCHPTGARVPGVGGHVQGKHMQGASGTPNGCKGAMGAHHTTLPFGCSYHSLTSCAACMTSPLTPLMASSEGILRGSTPYAARGACARASPSLLRLLIPPRGTDVSVPTSPP